MRKAVTFLLLASFSFIAATALLVVAAQSPLTVVRHWAGQTAALIYSLPAIALPKPKPRLTPPTSDSIATSGQRFATSSLTLEYAATAATTTATTTSTTTDDIATDNWRIYYRQTDFDKAGAYTLRFPRDWGINDETDGEVIFSYEYDGYVYTTVLTEEALDPPPGRRETVAATTTKIADRAYKEAAYIKNGTTTLLVYTPQFSPRPFARVIASLPEKASDRYARLVRGMLATLEIEPAVHAYTARVSVLPNTIQLKTATALPRQGEVRWHIRPLVKEAKQAVAAQLTIEDADGEVLYELGKVSRLKGRLPLRLPPLCEAAEEGESCIAREDIRFLAPYFVVLRGYTCKALEQIAACPESLRVTAPPVRSNTFVFTDAKEFQNPRIRIRKEPGTDFWRIRASVTGRGNPNEQFVLVFDDGAYEVLTTGDGLHFAGEWLRMYADGKKHTFTLIRAPRSVVAARFYGAKTAEEIMTLGEIIHQYAHHF